MTDKQDRWKESLNIDERFSYRSGYFRAWDSSESLMFVISNDKRED